MLNLKKMVSALLGVTMIANMALSIPAFAEETVDRTYVYDDYEITYDVTNSPNCNVEAEKNVETVETSQTTASAYETTTSVVNVDTIVEGTSETTTDVSKETFSSNDQNIAFVYNDFSWGSGAYSYSGIYVTENGDVYKFAINNHESWTYRTFDFEYVPVELYGYADLSDAFPQTSMLQELNSATYEKVGNISTEEVDYYLDLLYSVDENQDVICEYRDEDNVLPYSETWGVRKSDGKVIFLNGGDDIYLTRTDENSDIIDKWLTSLANNYITSEVDTIFSTATTVTTTFSTTTTLTTTEVKPNTEQETEPITEVPKIEFCQVQFILDYEKYYGIFLDSNRDVYSFAIDNVTENWNLYGAYSDIPIKLTDSMPQDGLLTYLYDHFDEWKFIGKTSEDDYADYKNELNQIDLNTEMTYILYAEPDVIGLSHTETFAVRYDDNGNRQIVFLCGGLDTEYDLYLENPDEHAISLNQKMIQYEKINESATTTTVELNQTNAGTDETTTATNSTTTTTTTSIVATDENKTTASIENITATTETTTTATTHIASDEEFCNWAAKDYEGKTGVMPANAEIEYIAEGTAVIMLTDVEGNVLDIYTIDPTTGIGKASDGGTVDLPQTGYSNTYKVIIGFAILMTMGGTVIVAKSRRKRTSHS